MKLLKLIYALFFFAVITKTMFQVKIPCPDHMAGCCVVHYGEVKTTWTVDIFPTLKEAEDFKACVPKTCLSLSGYQVNKYIVEIKE